MTSNNNSAIEPPTRKFHLRISQNRSLLDPNLDQAIKKNNVRNFINKGLTQVNQNIKIDTERFSGLQDHLLNLKKSVSQLSRQIKNKEAQSLKFKDQTFFATQKIKKLNQQRLRLQDKINQSLKNLDKVNNKRQAAVHTYRTYEHILERMKKDNILQQFSKNQLQRQLKTLQKNQTMMRAKHYTVSQLQKLSAAGVKDAQDQLQKQQSFRKNNLSFANKQSNRKTTKQNKLKQSQSQSDQIHEMGACDIQDADLMRLKKFMTVQLFLREVLKSKMSKLKRFYEPYEHAFFQIKSKTNVRDSNSLKYEFFNFQNTYNQKTAWVKTLQEQIGQQQQQNRKLKQKLKQERIIEMQLIQKMQTMYQKTDNQINIRQLNERSLHREMLWQKIQGWIRVYGEKLRIQTKEEDNIRQVFQKIMRAVSKKQSDKKQTQVTQINLDQKQQKQNEKNCLVEQKQTNLLNA